MSTFGGTSPFHSAAHLFNQARIASEQGSLPMRTYLVGLPLRLLGAEARIGGDRRSIAWLGQVLLSALVAATVVAAVAWLKPWTGRALAAEEVAIEVKASQWDWKFSTKKVPAGKPIVFNVVSSDVSHGFTIYDQDGTAVVETAVIVPGQVNQVRHVFAKPGVYPVRCMVYCGMGHDGMKNELKVVSGVAIAVIARRLLEGAN